MKRLFLLVLFLAAVPLMSMCTSGFVKHDVGSDWRKATTQQLGARAAASVPPIEVVCGNAKTRNLVSESCFNLRIMDWLHVGAVGALALGATLLVAIVIAGQVAKYRRSLLWALFGPGLRVTVVALVFLIGLHGALAMVSIWFGESALIGQVHIQVMGLIGFGAIAGVIAMSKATMSIVKKVTSNALGQPLTRESQPTIWDTVEGLARRLGVEPPQHILAGVVPTFYVTEADVEYPGGQLSGRTLYLSLALCRILSTSELEAVVGHELAHFHGADTAFSQRFYPVYRSAKGALHALGGNRGGAYGLSLLPAIHLLSLFVESFAKAESTLSREREIVADRTGADLAGLHAMGSALVKIHAFADKWAGIHETMRTELAHARKVENASMLFAQTAQEQTNPEGLQGLDKQRVPHPTDSHPPLSQRLEALHLTLADLADAAMQTKPSRPAIHLFGHAEGLEANLTETHNRFLVESGRVMVGSALG